MKNLLLIALLLISAGWLNKYMLDPGLIMDEVYDIEYNIC